MNDYKVSILFVIALNRKRNDGKAPLFCRITYKGKRKQFATGVFLNPKNWNLKAKNIKSLESNSKEKNAIISLINSKINQAFLVLQMEGNDFSVNDLYSKFQGEGNKKDKSILDLVRFHNNRMEKQIGAGVAFTTWEKYHQTQNHLSGFLSKFYKRKDFPINELKDKFLIDFEYYLQSERGFLMTSNK